MKDRERGGGRRIGKKGKEKERHREALVYWKENCINTLIMQNLYTVNQVSY